MIDISYELGEQAARRWIKETKCTHEYENYKSEFVGETKDFQNGFVNTLINEGPKDCVCEECVKYWDNYT